MSSEPAEILITSEESVLGSITHFLHVVAQRREDLTKSPLRAESGSIKASAP